MRTIKTFGRTKGRPLSPNQAILIEQKLQQYRLPEIPAGFDPKTIVSEKSEIWFEIGFGGAEHLLAQAKANSQALLIGAEPFVDGVAKAMMGIEGDKIENIRIIDNDARPILLNLKNECLDRVFILFPDPWHKLRHHKRRLINDEFVANLVRIMKKGGRLRFASDWANYAEEALACFLRNSNLEWCAKSQADWQTPPEDHVTTRYQTKKLGDCEPQFFDFIRL